MKRTLLRRSILLVAIAAFAVVTIMGKQSGPLPAKQRIRLDVVNVERLSKDNLQVRVKLVNGSEAPIFVEESGRGQPWILQSVSIYKWIQGRGWVFTGPTLDIPPLSVIKVDDKQELQSTLNLSDPFERIFPSQESIPMHGKFRAQLRYFASERDWQVFMSQIRDPGSPSSQAQITQPLVVVSSPFLIHSMENNQ
jgi:hypothetical protein